MSGDAEFLTAAELVVRARGLTMAALAREAPTQELPAPRECVFCGRPMKAGALARPISFPSTFVDWSLLHEAPGDAVACLPCGHVASGEEYRKRLGRGFVAGGRLYRLVRASDLAWLVLNTPQPPLAAWYGTASSVHIIWHTPVSESSDLILLRHNRMTLSIRPSRVRDAWAALQAYRDLRSKAANKPARRRQANREASKKGGKKSKDEKGGMPVFLGSGLKKLPGTLGLRRIGDRLLEEHPELRGPTEMIEALPPGELLALGCVSSCDGRPDEPEHVPPKASGRA